LAGPIWSAGVKDATGDASKGLLFALLPLIGGLLVFLSGQESKVEFAAQERAG
jgi:MFS transporter, ACS family, tartrate transporter